MKPQIKPPAVRALDTLALALEEQWVVAGLGPRAVPAEVLSRAIEACMLPCSVNASQPNLTPGFLRYGGLEPTPAWRT